MKEFSVEMAADIVKSIAFIGTVIKVQLWEVPTTSEPRLSLVAALCITIIIVCTCESFIRLFTNVGMGILEYTKVIKLEKDANIKNI